MKFLNYANNVLDRFTRFDTMDHVVITPSADGITATGFAKDATMFIKAETEQVVDGLDTPACFGNLKYLAKICTMDQFALDTSKVDIQVGVDVSGDKAVTDIMFSGPRVKVNYEAVDAKFAKVVIPRVEINNWEVQGEMSPEHSKEFGDINQLYKLTDPSFLDFAFVCKDGNLNAVFGTGKKEISLAMIPGTGLTKTVYFNAARFSKLLAVMAVDVGGVLSVTDKALMLNTTSGGIDYTFVMPATTNPR